jgi:hypothetical protein
MKSYGINSVRGAFAAGFAAAHGVPYPTGDRKRREALQQLHSNERLKEILTIEPRLRPIIEVAKHQENQPGYHRIQTYTRLKNQVSQFVGWFCSNPALKNDKDYSLVILLVGDLLPTDDVDLFPRGKAQEVES